MLVTLGLCLMLVLDRWAARPRPAVALLGGVVAGGTALVRANGLLFVPVAALWMVWLGLGRADGRRAAGRGTAAHAAVFLAGAVMAIAPATVRNAVVADDFVLISANGAVNLYIGNNSEADGTSARIPGLQELTGFSDWSWFRYGRIVEGISRHEGRPMTYSEVSAWFMRRALDEITAHPGRFLRLCVRRAALFWGPAEVSNNKSVHFEKRFSRTLRYIPNFPFVLSLSLAGLVILLLDHRAGGKKAKPSIILVLLYICTIFASFVPFLAAARFRVPLLPMLFLFGAYGLHRIGLFAAAGDWRRIAWALGGWLLLFAAASVPLADYTPDPAWWLTEQGDSLARGGRLEAAAEAFNDALRANPGYVGAHLHLASVLVELGRNEAALEHYRDVARHRPDNVDAVLPLGSLLVDMGRPEEALPYLHQAAEAAPGRADVHFALGKAHARMGNHEAAESSLRRSLGIDPHRPMTYLYLGIALAGQEAYEPAIEAYRQALQLEPDFWEALYNMGSALRRTGALDPAAAAFVRAHEINPGLPDIPIIIGDIREGQGRRDEAASWYREALRVEPESTLARCRLAGVLSAQGRYRDAVTELEAALRIDPRCEDARRMLATLRVE